MTFSHLIGGALYEVHPVEPLSFGTAAVGLPFGAPRRRFSTLSTPQFQKSAGSCVAQARAFTLESEAKSRLGPSVSPQVSIQDAYRLFRALEGNGAETRDGGSYPSLARLG